MMKSVPPIVRVIYNCPRVSYSSQFNVQSVYLTIWWIHNIVHVGSLLTLSPLNSGFYCGVPKTLEWTEHRMCNAYQVSICIPLFWRLTKRSKLVEILIALGENHISRENWDLSMHVQVFSVKIMVEETCPCCVS